ncbi:hypothetical protein TNCV_1464351 [Trichonephila clavipes]|nr:hypothetical protein TNCV_1464351 [Trichonephila clavipes]
MEDDKVFALNLSLYPGADLGDFINFMVLIRSHVNTLKPSEIIALGSPVDMVEKIRQLFPHLDLRDFPSLEPYAHLEPTDLSPDYLEQEARKRKRSLYPGCVDCNQQAQTIQFGVQGLDRAGSTDSSPRDSIG